MNPFEVKLSDEVRAAAKNLGKKGKEYAEEAQKVKSVCHMREPVLGVTAYPELSNEFFDAYSALGEQYEKLAEAHQDLRIAVEQFAAVVASIEVARDGGLSND